MPSIRGIRTRYSLIDFPGSAREERLMAVPARGTNTVPLDCTVPTMYCKAKA
jgi:hypothetical protein